MAKISEFLNSCFSDNLFMFYKGRLQKNVVPIFVKGH